MAKVRRKKIIYWCVGVVGGIAIISVVGAGLLAYSFGKDWPTSRKVTQTILSPDGAYSASVVDLDWGFSGASMLEVKPKKASRFSVRLSRWFASSYSDSFEEIIAIKWVGNRTLQVKYAGVPGGDGDHATAWGDVHFDNKPIPVQ